MALSEITDAVSDGRRQEIRDQRCIVIVVLIYMKKVDTELAGRCGCWLLRKDSDSISCQWHVAILRRCGAHLTAKKDKHDLPREHHVASAQSQIDEKSS